MLQASGKLSSGDGMRQLRIFIASLLLTLCAGMSDSALAGNVRVWVNANSHVYHCPGSQYYGNTKRGTYLSESQAVAQGNRPAYGQPCASEGASASTATAKGLLSAPPAGNSTKVWVNSSSNVYHCPGTRYYGATKRGRYMTEAEAIAAGNRPAYGTRC
jgi:hypothetical protein